MAFRISLQVGAASVLLGPNPNPNPNPNPDPLQVGAASVLLGLSYASEVILNGAHSLLVRMKMRLRLHMISAALDEGLNSLVYI